MQNKIIGLPNNKAVVQVRDSFKTPVRVTHRINEGGKSVVHGLQFDDVKMLGNKQVATND